MQKAGLLLALLAALVAISCGNAAAPVRVQVTHTDAGRGLTRRELMQRMAQRSKARAARLLSKASGGAPVTPGQIDVGGVPDTEYLVHFSIGTPPQPVQMTLDTGSDLVWTQCLPCPSCFDQALPYFDPSLSSTSAVLPCGSSECQNMPVASCGTGTQNSYWGNQTCVYTYSYGDKSVTTGFLSSDTFTFSGAAVPRQAFGCGLFNNGIFKSNETGIAGFGRGDLSVPRQLKADNFSYCFTTITGSTPSPVLLGLPANLYGSTARGAVQTTPLVQNPSVPTLYYLSLKGITVGSTRLPVPESTFALTTNGTGGTFIDSGTGMTSLPDDVFNLVVEAFVAHVKLPVDNSTSPMLCFSTPAHGKKPDVPKLVFHFEGATLDLPRENYMFEIDDAAGSVSCLAVNGGGDQTIIGNYQQQNMHVLYDLAGNKLSFVPAQCDKL